MRDGATTGARGQTTARKLVKSYKVFCIAAAAFLVLFAAARLGLLRAAHQDEARAGFQSVRAGARTAMAAYEARDDAYFSSAMRELASAEPRLQLLAVHEQGRGVYYFLARDPDLFPVPPAPTADMAAVPAYRSPALTALRLVSSFGIGDADRRVTVEAQYEVLGSADLHTLGRETVYVLLVFLIATATMLLVISSLSGAAAEVAARRQSAPKSSAGEPRGSFAAPAPEEAREGAPAGGPPAPETEPALEPEPFPAMAGDEAAEAIASLGDVDSPALPPEPEPIAPWSEPPAPDAAPRAATGDAARGGAMSIYSDLTGLVYQDFLSNRLRSEIDRAAASDQDMVLAMIGIDGFDTLPRRDAIYGALAAKLRETFTYRDLLFEQERGYAVIVPDINLDKALERMEDLRVRVASGPIEGQTVTVSIGIAARNGRLIGEQTLLKEAAHSLAKAVRDGANQVVAFRADPDKFRRVLAT